MTSPGRSGDRHTPIGTETWKAAVAETNRLQRELDITNADHIALWLEANTIPDEPMSQCISWLACRIVEAHERATNPELINAAEAAKVLIGARNDNLSEALRQANINEAWHILNRAIAKATGKATP